MENNQPITMLPMWSVTDRDGKATRNAACITRSHWVACDSTHPESFCDESGVHYLECSQAGSLYPGKVCARHWYEQHRGYPGVTTLQDMAGDEYDTMLRAFAARRGGELYDTVYELLDEAARLEGLNYREEGHRLRMIAGEFESMTGQRPRLYP